MTKDTYRLAGNRQGWDFKGCTRTDKPDGYSEFRKPNGTASRSSVDCIPNTGERRMTDKINTALILRRDDHCIFLATALLS
jgi:hypothetical protein